VHVAVLAGERHGDLPLQVEMLLAAQPHPSAQASRGGGERRCRFTAPHGLRRQHEQAALHGVVDGEDRQQHLVFDAAEQDRRAGRGEAVGGDGEHRLAVILDQIRREDRVAGERRPDIVDAGDVCRRHHGDDTRRCQHGAQVEIENAGVGVLAQEDGGVQQGARLRDVVDI